MYIILAVATLGLAACDTPAKTVGLGAGIGATAAAVTGNNPVTGAVIGAGAGAVCELAEGCN
ncbi:hypothetical protein R5H32_13795 [Defluviimonas sp. D31]|nr:hypothetical protein [Defluviimonas sp. D31]